MPKNRTRKKFSQVLRDSQYTREHGPRHRQIESQTNPELPGLVESSGSESEDEATPLTDDMESEDESKVQENGPTTASDTLNSHHGGPKTEELQGGCDKSDQAAVPSLDYLRNLVQKVQKKHQINEAKQNEINQSCQSINQGLPETTTLSNERLKMMVKNVKRRHFNRPEDHGASAVRLGKTCNSPGCDLAAKLQCPTCIKLNIQGSFFCTQDCFKSNWKLHKNLHKLAKSDNTSQSSEEIESAEIKTNLDCNATCNEQEIDNNEIQSLKKLVTHFRARHKESSFENLLNAWPTNMECDANSNEEAIPQTPKVAEQTTLPAGHPGPSSESDGSVADDESDEVQRESSGGRKTRVLIDRRTRGSKRSCNSNRYRYGFLSTKVKTWTRCRQTHPENNWWIQVGN